MSHSGIHQLGGGQQPPFDPVAQQTLDAMRGQLATRNPYLPPPPLSPEEQAEAEEAAKQDARICQYCIGLHAKPGTLGCPRIASGKLDGDGRLVEFTYWPGRDWAAGRVVFAEDAFTEPEGGDD